MPFPAPSPQTGPAAAHGWRARGAGLVLRGVRREAARAPRRVDLLPCVAGWAVVAVLRGLIMSLTAAACGTALTGSAKFCGECGLRR